MLYIHSMWSSPAIKYKNDKEYLIKNFHIYLLSALLIKKHGHRIELFCDKNTYEIYSMIPYDKIHVIDFNSDGIDKFFWTWGKFKAQMMVDEPYVHIDGDVLMFRDIIGNKMKRGDYSAVIQSIEDDNSIGEWFNKVYKKTAKSYMKNKYNINWHKYNLTAYNCGVVGFYDMGLKNEYLKKVKEILRDLSNDTQFDRNTDSNSGIFMITEQSLLYYMLNERHIKPLEIIPYKEMEKYKFDWYHKIPRNIGYCHMLGPSKYKDKIKEKIVFKIKKYFPEYYYIIHNFMNKYELINDNNG